jgi:alcohol dehydrogenase class IV
MRLWLRSAAAMNVRFTWRDGERLIRFRSGLLVSALEELAANGWTRFELLSTARALRAAPVELPERAAAVHEVPPGTVPQASAAILDEVTVPSLVALGGGRVIDVAKAIAAVRGGRVAAIPSTLSGAEMTRIHRLPEGHEAPGRIRPVLVLADPEPMTSLPEADLRASAMNALAHGVEPLYVPGANPVASMAALKGAELIAQALDQPRGDRDRDALALGSLLCAYALDSAGLAIHHVVCQTLVRVLGVPHAPTYAALLPRTMEAMRPRVPDAIAELAEAIGTEPERIGERLEALGGGHRRLSDLGADRGRLDGAIGAMLRRPELADTPDPPGREELVDLVSSAW